MNVVVGVGGGVGGGCVVPDDLQSKLEVVVALKMCGFSGLSFRILDVYTICCCC